VEQSLCRRSGSAPQCHCLVMHARSRHLRVSVQLCVGVPSASSTVFGLMLGSSGLSLGCRSQGPPRPGAFPEQTHAVSNPAPTARGASTAPGEVVVLAAVIERPANYVGRTVRVRGRGAVCLDTCAPIAIRCEGLDAATCSGHGAISVAPAAGPLAKCLTSLNPDGASAIAIDTERAQLACTSSCGKWTCSGIELGHEYEVSGVLRESRTETGSASDISPASITPVP